MRAFLLLSLISLTLAAPQGYSYVTTTVHQPHQQYGPASSNFVKDLQTIMSIQSSNFVDTYPSAEAVEHAPSSAEVDSAPSAPALQPPLQYLAPAPAAGVGTTLQQPLPQQEAVVSKRFYLHSAPEEEDEQIQHRTITVGKPRKNYNVVFIKAPIKPAQRTSIKISPAISEEKTVIYVLDKKQDAADIEAHVHEPLTTTAKPEVFFIKYQTAEEAAHAQQSIQAQYDSLGGSTHVSNEGVAPVSSVIGSLDALQHAQAAPEADIVSVQSNAQLSGHNGNGYLPPFKKFY